MAEGTKTHVEKLGSLADFRAPWETDAGEVEIDKTRLKQYLYNGALDKAKSQDAREEAEAKIATAEAAKTAAETDAKKARKELADSDSTGKIAELTETAAKEKARADAAEGQVLRITVGDEKGLSIKQSLRLQGDSKEELESDADEIADLFGLKPGETDEEREAREEAEENGEPVVRREPRLQLATKGGGDGGDDVGPTSEADFVKAVSGLRKHTL